MPAAVGSNIAVCVCIQRSTRSWLMTSCATEDSTAHNSINKYWRSVYISPYSHDVADCNSQHQALHTISVFLYQIFCGHHLPLRPCNIIWSTNCLCCWFCFLFVFSCISFPFYFNFSYRQCHIKIRLHTRFHFVYCIFAIVAVYHFLYSLIAFDSQKINESLTYLLTKCLLALLNARPSRASSLTVNYQQVCREDAWQEAEAAALIRHGVEVWCNASTSTSVESRSCTYAQGQGQVRREAQPSPTMSKAGEGASYMILWCVVRDCGPVYRIFERNSTVPSNDTYLIVPISHRCC